MEIIAKIYNNYKEKFGIPRQSGLVDEVISVIKLEGRYNCTEAIRGIEEFDYIWLLWGFSKNHIAQCNLTVRPPRLGGNTRKGVFATRSPFRPNGIGMSSVRLLSVNCDVNGVTLTVAGADLMDGTPIYDIKPYIPYSDSHPDASGGFSDASGFLLDIVDEEKILDKLAEADKKAVIKILSNDPRPSYHNDAERIYGMRYGEYNIKFSVEERNLKVHQIQKNGWEDDDAGNV